MTSLTRRQKQIYEYVRDYIDKRNISPTFEEIRKHFRLKAFSTVHEHIEALINRGVITKRSNLARSIAIPQKDDLVEIQLKGTIAAGLPIQAFEEYETITVSRRYLPSSL